MAVGRHGGCGTLLCGRGRDLRRGTETLQEACQGVRTEVTDQVSWTWGRWKRRDGIKYLSHCPEKRPRRGRGGGGRLVWVVPSRNMSGGMPVDSTWSLQMTGPNVEKLINRHPSKWPVIFANFEIVQTVALVQNPGHSIKYGILPANWCCRLNSRPGLDAVRYISL